jgi:hypothetical protein
MNYRNINCYDTWTWDEQYRPTSLQVGFGGDLYLEGTQFETRLRRLYSLRIFVVPEHGGQTSSFFSFGATAPIWALAYLLDTLRFTSVF